MKAGKAAMVADKAGSLQHARRTHRGIGASANPLRPVSPLRPASRLVAHSFIPGCRFFLVCLLAITFFGQAGFAWSQTIARSGPRLLATLNVALQWSPQSQFAGYYMAKVKDLYKSAGLDVRLHHADAAHTSLDMLREGSVQLATSFLADALIASAAGMVPMVPQSAPSRIAQIAQIVRRSNLMLLSWKELGIDSAKDLDRRPVSYWQGSFSSSYEAFFRANGIHPVQIPQYYSVSLFLKRGVVACAAMEYNEYNRISQAGVDDDRLTIFYMRDYGLGFPEDGVYARGDWIARNRETARAFRDATLKGWEYARTHVDETIDIVMAEAQKAGVPANRPHERWMLKHILDSIFIAGEPAECLGTLDFADFEKTLGSLRAAGLIAASPSFESFVPLQEKQR